MRPFVWISTGFLALLTMAAPAFAQKRVALVIGNGAYKIHR